MLSSLVRNLSDSETEAVVLQHDGGPSARLRGSRRKWRVAFYSHDTMGIGHIRRNLLIAQAMMASGRVSSSLMLAGVREARTLAMPPGVDCVTVPSLEKRTGGYYRPRYLRVSLKALVSLRAEIIAAAVAAYQPDVFVVDKAPRGARRELELVLRQIRERGRTHCVLGLREVLDDPATVRREWLRDGNVKAIREFYDAVWVYGDPAVYDPVREYGFPQEIAAKVRYTGYFDHRVRLNLGMAEAEDPLRRLALPPGKFVLCMVGGGQDGERLAQAFCEAVLPPKTNGVLVMGPFMPADGRRRLQALAAGRPRFRVLDFVAEPSRFLEQADRVVAMGGYNTLSEVLSFEKRALIVPRTELRQEQWIRAERMRNMGLVDMLKPAEADPAAITAWLARDLGPAPSFRQQVDLEGLARLPKLLNELFARPCYRRPAPPRLERMAR